MHPQFTAETSSTKKLYSSWWKAANMHPQFTAETPFNPFDSLKVVKESVTAFNQIVQEASEDLLKIQSAVGTSTFLDSLMNLAPYLSGAGTQHLAWQIPALYQTQAERILKSLLDSVGVLSRSQQGIFELTAQSLSRTVQKTANAMAKVNETVACRRVTAEIIDFADRREKAQAVSTRTDDATNDASDDEKISYPKARKAAG